MEIVIQHIHQHFPPVINAIAYGSAVFTQFGRQPGRMLDLLLVVSNARQWHHHNLALNPHHYSTLSRMIGADLIESIQSAPGGLYFNTSVSLEGVCVKYGVISRERALCDLTTWKDLIFAGRLHKPIQILIGQDDQIARANQQINRPSALLLSLQRLKRRHRVQCSSWFDVFMEIVNISYAGDIRMLLQAEDKRKVWRIVEGQFEELANIYHPIARQLELDHCNDKVQLANINNQDLIIKHNTKCTLFKSTAVQSMKGLISAKPTTIFTYLMDKFKKRLFT